MTLRNQQIRALAQKESANKPKAVGDGGRAFGLYQMHSDFRADWYTDDLALRQLSIDADTLARFAAQFYARFEIEWDDVESAGLTPSPETIELLLLCYNQGVRGAAEWLCADAGRTPAAHPYVVKYMEILASMP